MEYISDDEYRQMDAIRQEAKIAELEKRLEDLKMELTGVPYKESDKVITLSVKNLKELIREVVREEFAKSTPYVPYTPPQPYWYGPSYPSEHQTVWCSDKTEEIKEPKVSMTTNPCGSLGYKHITSYTTEEVK